MALVCFIHTQRLLFPGRYHMYGVGIGTFEVMASVGGAQYYTVWAKSGQLMDRNFSPWAEVRHQKQMSQ